MLCLRYFLVLQSLDYCMRLGGIAKRHQFRKQLLAYKVKEPILFKEDIQIVFSTDEIISKKEVIEQLTLEGMKIKKGEFPQSQQNYITFDELTYKLFNIPKDSCLLVAGGMSNLLLSYLRTCHSENKMSFRVQQLKKSHQFKQSNWYIIKRVDGQRDNQNSFTPCQGLIKLNKFLTINTHLFIKINQINMKKGNHPHLTSQAFFQELFSLGRRHQCFFFKFQELIGSDDVHLKAFKYQFRNNNDLIYVLRHFYKYGYQNCLQEIAKKSANQENINYILNQMNKKEDNLSLNSDTLTQRKQIFNFLADKSTNLNAILKYQPTIKKVVEEFFFACHDDYPLCQKIIFWIQYRIYTSKLTTEEKINSGLPQQILFNQYGKKEIAKEWFNVLFFDPCSQNLLCANFITLFSSLREKFKIKSFKDQFRDYYVHQCLSTSQLLLYRQLFKLCWKKFISDYQKKLQINKDKIEEKKILIYKTQQYKTFFCYIPKLQIINFPSNGQLNQTNKKSTQINFDLKQYPNYSCLGCTQFFIRNQEKDAGQSMIHLRIFEGHFRSISKEKFSNQICYMLNNQGGVILIKNYGRLLPRGIFSNKRQSQQQLNDYFKSIIDSFYPKVKLGQNIIIKLVPVLQQQQKPLKHAKAVQYKQPEKQCQFHEERTNANYTTYLARIKVVSKDQSKVYFWDSGMANSDQKIYSINSSIMIDSMGLQQRQPIRRIYKLIKKKVKKYSKKSFKPKTWGNPLNHKCKQPLDFA